MAFGAALPSSGYLAVDFCFVLSGFVMAHAYGARLDTGLSPRGAAILDWGLRRRLGGRGGPVAAARQAE